MLTAALFTRAKNENSLNEWINKMWYSYTMEYYSTIIKNEVLIHGTTWMNFENMQSERSQTQKTTYCTIPFYVKWPE